MKTQDIKKRKNSRFPLYLLLAGIFVTTTASTCEFEHDDDDDHGSHHSIAAAPVINTATSGTWKIAYYSDSGNDRTAWFANYLFTFNPDNAVLATNGDNSFTGSWSVANSHHSKSGSDDDYGSSDVDFNLGFGSPAQFAELTDDWNIVSYSANRIELIDVSGGNGGTDYITFEKI